MSQVLPRLTLFITGTSPFVRQCRIVARERCILEWVAERTISADPDTDQHYLDANPAGHGPALVYEGGSLIGAASICAYFDSLGTQPPLSGNTAGQKWAITERAALALAAVELATRLMHERRRRFAERSATWMSRWLDGLSRVLDRLESRETDELLVDMGRIATVVAATYLDFRLPDVPWREGRPRLASAQHELERRDSFKTTHPLLARTVSAS
jgi:glutathione S-transferase